MDAKGWELRRTGTAAGEGLALLWSGRTSQSFCKYCVAVAAVGFLHWRMTLSRAAHSSAPGRQISDLTAFSYQHIRRPVSSAQGKMQVSPSIEYPKRTI